METQTPRNSVRPRAHCFRCDDHYVTLPNITYLVILRCAKAAGPGNAFRSQHDLFVRGPEAQGRFWFRENLPTGDGRRCPNAACRPGVRLLETHFKRVPLYVRCLSAGSQLGQFVTYEYNPRPWPCTIIYLSTGDACPDADAP